VHLGDDSIVEAIVMGSTIVEVIVKDKTKMLKIKNVFHVPKLYNLLALRVFVKKIECAIHW